MQRYVTGTRPLGTEEISKPCKLPSRDWIRNEILHCCQPRESLCGKILTACCLWAHFLPGYLDQRWGTVAKWSPLEFPKEGKWICLLLSPQIWVKGINQKAWIIGHNDRPMVVLVCHAYPWQCTCLVRLGPEQHHASTLTYTSRELCYDLQSIILTRDVYSHKYRLAATEAALLWFRHKAESPSLQEHGWFHTENQQTGIGNCFPAFAWWHLFKS